MRKKSVILIVFLVIVMLLTIVKAEAMVKIGLSSNSEFEKGKTVEVTMKITEIDAGNGIDAIIGQINYDENIFEKLTVNDFENKNDWRIQGYNSESKLFTILRTSKVNESSEILKITFKVKDNVQDKVTKIELKDLVASGGIVQLGGTGDIEIDPVTITIGNEISPIVLYSIIGVAILAIVAIVILVILKSKKEK